jgi:hypothetical protein
MIPTPKYLTREVAAAFITAQGIATTERALSDLAYRGRGPKFSHVRGRAVYTQEGLMAWIEAEMSRPVQRRRRSAGQQPADAA